MTTRKLIIGTTVAAVTNGVLALAGTIAATAGGTSASTSRPLPYSQKQRPSIWMEATAGRAGRDHQCGLRARP